MKILFAYFDFTANDSNTFSTHLHDEYALNFSTKYTFRVTKKKIQDSSEETCHYIISLENKPKSDRLPSDFWGERIYNITTIVGDNGSGKSTIIHSIIQAIVKGLQPNVPFLLVLKPTGAESAPYVFCSNKNQIRCGENVAFPILDEYPDDLLKAKCMLLDNTLSINSLHLDRSYEPNKL